ncbi:hypothetical protein D3C80_1577370 [compost metagenome]
MRINGLADKRGDAGTLSRSMNEVLGVAECGDTSFDGVARILKRLRMAQGGADDRRGDRHRILDPVDEFAPQKILPAAALHRSGRVDGYVYQPCDLALVVVKRAV